MFTFWLLFVLLSCSVFVSAVSFHQHSHAGIYAKRFHRVRRSHNFSMDRTSSTQPPALTNNSSPSMTTAVNAVQSSSSEPSSAVPTSLVFATTGLANNALDALFPVSDTIHSWTTSQASDSALPLSDQTFRPKNTISSIVPLYTNSPDGKLSMKVHFSSGSWAYKGPPGGVSFYAPGPPSVDLTTAKEATFGYSVYFEDEFAFNKGGKLPGLYGGNSESEAIGCSGGRRSSACFSARLMWRTAGAGELYTYLPPFTEEPFSANERQCHVPPLSRCNSVYGASVGRGSFHFVPGRWTTVSQRVRLNDIGTANGEIELFVNGQSVINVDGLILRDSPSGRLRGIQMQSFFGGSTSEWASPKDQNIYFSDFSVAVTQAL
ncbi:hypothetical protein AX15_004964 [Amanita polypyramis BW_CC]|nr:hypothetical protein AX15_004964 [Amanita polypyramis BW_CC]